MSKLPYKRAEESNPFFCEEDDDDWGSNSGFKNRSRNQFDDGNDELEQLQVKIDASENRSLDSITRTRQVLAETEDIGNKTAEVIKIFFSIHLLTIINGEGVHCYHTIIEIFIFITL